MVKKFEGTTPPQESLEDLKYQKKRVLKEHEQLRQASENDPKDSKLRVAVDEAYDKWQEICHKISQLKGEQEE